MHSSDIPFMHLFSGQMIGWPQMAVLFKLQLQKWIESSLLPMTTV